MTTLARSSRRRFLERFAVAALLALAILLAGGYLVTLLHLLLRGGKHLVAFGSGSTALSGAEGEAGMRMALAAAFGATSAWALLSLTRPLVSRFVSDRWESKSRVRLALVAIAALVGAITLKDDLPPFLVSLPRETSAGGGIGPQLFNTVYLAIASTAVTFPIGLGAAIYLARLARPGWLTSSARMALDTLASLPSIVYGLFGFLVFVVKMQAGYSLFAGACVLALINLPLVVGIVEESLRGVPREIEEASFALGATRTQTILRVTLPFAWPGIVSAMVLSIGRVFAESAPLIMTAGTTISRANPYSLDPMRGGETLAVHLWYLGSSGLAPDRAEVSAGTAATLVVLVMLTNLLAARIARLGRSGSGRRVRAMTK